MTQQNAHDAALAANDLPPAERLRALCLALPEATEKEAWGEPTYRVRDRIFAMEHSGEGETRLWCKAPPGSQEILVGADPQRFFVPPYIGPKGWIGMRLHDDSGLDWEEVRFIVRRSYSLIAPKKLAALLEPDPKTAGRDGGDA